MKLKALSLVAGIVALTVTTAPFAAQAQSRFNGSVRIAQSQGEQAPRKFGKFGKFEQLGLTDAQRSQIQAIMQETRTQMANVLTPEQRQQMQTAMENGGKKGGFRNLNLTEDQRTRMREIKEAQKQKINAVLTEEQRQKLTEMKQNRANRRSSFRNR